MCADVYRICWIELNFLSSLIILMMMVMMMMMMMLLHVTIEVGRCEGTQNAFQRAQKVYGTEWSEVFCVCGCFFLWKVKGGRTSVD